MQNPRLENVLTSTPCPKQWAELVGDDTRRYCDECQLHVHNLSAMTRGEGERFLLGVNASEERVCATYVRRGDGSIVTCPTWGECVTRRLRRSLQVAASFAAGLLSFAGLGACTPATAEPTGAQPPDPVEGCETRLLGEMTVEPGATCEVPAPGIDDLRELGDIELTGRIAVED